MDKRPEESFFQACEKMLNIPNHQGQAKQSHDKISATGPRLEWLVQEDKK